MSRWDDGDEMLIHNFIENYDQETSTFGLNDREASSNEIYISLSDARKVIEQALNRTISPEIEKFLRVVLPYSNNRYFKGMVCKASIDDTVIKKCKEWLDLHEDAERLFCKIEMKKLTNEKSRIFHDDFDKNLSEFTPFSESWRTRDIENIFKIETPSRSHQSCHSDSHRHRGRTAPIETEVTGERPFMCTFQNCKRAFKRLEHLKRHFKMHTGERPYKCTFPGCRRAFSRSDNLNSHFRVHGVMGNSSQKTRRNFDR